MSDVTRGAPDRTARRKTKTRHQLMEAALELVLEKGYEDLMTDEITDAADLGRRTFYNHFVNKRDCVEAAVKERFARYAQDLASTLEPDAEGESEQDQAMVIATMASQIFLTIANDPITRQLMLYPRILNDAISESQRDFMTANLARGITAGRFKPDLHGDALEPVVSWGFVGLVIASITRDSQEEASQAWARFLLYNLGIEEAESNELLTKLDS